MSFWKNKRVTVTGGKGFLGTRLVKALKDKRGCKNVYIADLPEYDLRKLEDKGPDLRPPFFPEPVFCPLSFTVIEKLYHSSTQKTSTDMKS